MSLTALVLLFFGFGLGTASSASASLPLLGLAFLRISLRGGGVLTRCPLGGVLGGES